jgi:amidase
MPTKPWEEISLRKRSDNLAKIPKEWILRSEFTNGLGAESDANVMDIPRRCGILSEKELELTEVSDAMKLLESLKSGKVRYSQQNLSRWKG